MILEKIHTRADLLALTDAEQGQLCREIREFLVRHVSRMLQQLLAGQAPPEP